MKDPTTSILALCSFLGINKNQADISHIVKPTSMDAMKAHFLNHSHRETLGNNSADFLIRKGIV